MEGDVAVLEADEFCNKGCEVNTKFCPPEAVLLSDAFEKIGLAIVSNTGTYTAWNVDVNLDPPTGFESLSVNFNEHVLECYNSLQYTLFETGRPETIDRTTHPRSDLNPEGVVIAALTLPRQFTGALLEGGRQLPDAFHLILSSSWLEKRPSPDDPQLYSLYLHKAITFGSGGTSYIDEFAKPRRVTYLMNYFTDTATVGQRNDGVEIERSLDCPMSSSLKLCAKIDDKVYTRCLMAAVGVDVPDTLAFVCRPRYELKSVDSSIKIVDLENDVTVECIRKEIEDFVSRRTECKKVVVKPSGSRFCASLGVTLHNASDVQSIVNAVLDLLSELREAESILVEVFIEHIKPRSLDEQVSLWGAKPSSRIGFRTRATVCRDYDNVPVCAPIVCAIGDVDQPINGHNAIPESLEATLATYNFDVPGLARALEKEIRAKSEAVLKAIMDLEKSMSIEDLGERFSQTCLISLDYIITETEGRFVPVAIEVNSHDCLFTIQSYDFIEENSTVLPVADRLRCAGELPDTRPDEKSGMASNESRLKDPYFAESSVRPLVRTMIARSQMYAMSHKKLLVIGSRIVVGNSDRSDSRENDVKIVLVDVDGSHVPRRDLYKFIQYNFSNHTKDEIHAANILNLVKQAGITVDGCITFVEDCVPLAAYIAIKLGYGGEATKLNARRTSNTYSLLANNASGAPHFPEVGMYTTPTYFVHSHEDLEMIGHRLTYPKVIKPECGSSGTCVRLVHSYQELTSQYTDVTAKLRRENDANGGTAVVVMDYIGGSEHDVIVVLFRRKLLAAFICDEGPRNYPKFTGGAAVMPSTIPPKKQTQLILAACQCCVAIGLTSGVFNVKMKLMAGGPKLLDISGHMSGLYRREWVRHIYAVDLVVCAQMIACGLKPVIPKIQPDKYLMGVTLPPDIHSRVFANKATRNELLNMGNRGEVVITPPGALTPPPGPTQHEAMNGRGLVNIAVKAGTSYQSKLKLINICQTFGISSDEYDVAKFVQYF